MTEARPCTVIDHTALPVDDASGYPAPFREHCVPLARRVLGDAAGLTQFGVNVLRLEPGQWSAQRHWHEAEDELVYVLEGEVVLVSDAGEQLMRPGDFAGFPAGHPDGHHLVNRSGASATVLEIGSRRADEVAHYPDVDLVFRSGPDGESVYTRKDGTPW